MARILGYLVKSALYLLSIALLAITFAVMQRNSFDFGDIVSDLPLLGAVWIAFAILIGTSMRLSGRWIGKREQHP